MRLLLLPISTRRTLIYCEPASVVVRSGERTWPEWAVNKATPTWATWEKSDKTVLRRTTEYGNKILRRIPFEEWGLKSIPGRKGGVESPPSSSDTQVQVRFPAQYIKLGNKSAMDVLHALATERTALHKKRFYWSAGLAPFTAPLAIVPV